MNHNKQHAEIHYYPNENELLQYDLQSTIMENSNSGKQLFITGDASMLEELASSCDECILNIPQISRVVIPQLRPLCSYHASDSLSKIPISAPPSGGDQMLH